MSNDDDDNDNKDDTRKKSNDDKHKTDTKVYPSWHNSIAGAVAGGGARVLTAPLDLIKIRRQLDFGSPLPRNNKNNNMVQTMWLVVQQERGGLLALFRGNLAAMHLWVWYAAVKFSVYEPTQRQLTCVQQEETNPTVIAFTAGALAGTAATVATYPLDLCRTALASVGMSSSMAAHHSSAAAAMTTTTTTTTPPPQTMMEFAQAVHRSAGWSGFYAGCGPALWQVIPYLGISFATYEAVLRMWRQSSRDNNKETSLSSSSTTLQVSVSGVAGTIAGGVSKLLIYPLDTAKKRLQAQSFAWISSLLFRSTTTTTTTLQKYQGTWHCLLTIVQEEGVGGLYRGLVPAVLKTMAATGLTFAFYTFTKNTLAAMHDEDGQRRQRRRQ